MQIKQILTITLLSQAVATAHVAAADYPTRPIRLIVAQTAGGNSDMVARAYGQRMGERLAEGMRALPGVSAVRGAGLMVAVELAAGDAAGVAAALRNRGVLVNAVTDSALRLIPPLVIDAAQVDLAIETLRAVLADRA